MTLARDIQARSRPAAPLPSAPPQRGELRQVPLDQIQVPDLRVTSVLDESLLDELEESIASQGILQPLQVESVGDELWLVDGLHRLAVARRLGWSEVPCLVVPGDQADVLLKNLVVNRQRGKSNPAQEAKLILYLRSEGNMPLEQIAELTGLSIGWCRKLHDIASLPGPVLALVGEGRLGISHAIELLALTDATQQVETADQAVRWSYTVADVRARVQVLLQPAAQPPPGGVQFDGVGKQSRVPILCFTCRADLGVTPPYVWLCGECQSLISEMWSSYQTALAAAAAPATATVA